jgi:hypothetical protein
VFAQACPKLVGSLFTIGTRDQSEEYSWACLLTAHGAVADVGQGQLEDFGERGSMQLCQKVDQRRHAQHQKHHRGEPSAVAFALFLMNSSNLTVAILSLMIRSRLFLLNRQ